MLRAHDRCSSTCLLLTPYNEDQSIQSEWVFINSSKDPKEEQVPPQSLPKLLLFIFIYANIAKKIWRGPFYDYKNETK